MGMNLYDLKVLHQRKNLGIDANPYFSWKIGSDSGNIKQTGYQILVKTGDEIVWDSGKVESDKQTFVEYEGDPLVSCSIYQWSVSVWNNYGESAAGTGSFETAFLKKSDWKALWVESTIERKPVTEYKLGNAGPGVYFQKKIEVNEEVKCARAYVTALGTYQMKVNGKRADDREFAPEFTAYDTVLYYQTYDITELLTAGENEIEMCVGDGWYMSLQASPAFKTQRARPAILMQFEVEYTDGRRETIGTDGTEKCSLGQIVYADIFQGEKADARNIPDFRHPVKVIDYGYETLKAQPMPPVRPMKELPAVNLYTSPKGETIVDFGQLIAGWARVHIDMPAGEEAVFEYFEVTDLEENYLNTMFAPQMDIYISDGRPVEYQPHFTFHGFRYIRVTGLDHCKKEDFTAVLLTTEKDNCGTFETSDARLNRLYQNVRWSQYNNMLSIPTDCPGREKAGWTGDILVYVKTALMNEDVTPFLSSWLNSVRENQADDGVVMITAPYTRLYDTVLQDVVKEYGDDRPTGVAGWSDAVVWVPYMMYQVTGNTRVIKDNMSAMKAWCDYIIKTAEEKRGYRDIPYEYDRYLWNTGFHFGEWLIPSQPQDPKHPYDNGKTTAYMMAPFFGYKSIRYFAELCEAAGDRRTADEYNEIADKMKWAIQEGIMRGRQMAEDLMGPYVVAFAFGLVPEDLWDEYRKRLLELIHANNDCLDTGFLATPFLLDALDIIGEHELAVKLLWQDRKPSWMYEVDHDATAIWEAWDADDARKAGRYVSFQHYALGCVDDWICRNIAGIDSDTPGFRHIIIHPKNDNHLTWFRRTFESEAGQIYVSVHDDRLEVEIPCNTTATVIWKGKKSEIGSGRYMF